MRSEASARLPKKQRVSGGHADGRPHDRWQPSSDRGRDRRAAGRPGERQHAAPAERQEHDVQALKTADVQKRLRRVRREDREEIRDVEDTRRGEW